MNISTETSEYVEYESLKGSVYRLYKTNPPTLVLTFDFSEPEFANRFQTWAELKAILDGMV